MSLSNISSDHLRVNQDQSPTAASKFEADGGGLEPGASRHGNFINYYRFHSAEERVSQLPRALLLPRRHRGRKYVALDIGCNAGDLTLELHKFLSKYLPDLEISILGIDLDPILIERAREKNDRPESVTFECLDFFSSDRESLISSYLRKHQVDRFNASFCFSITMWIHLNTGDSGLERFLLDVCSCSESILVEPQPWRCYRQASRRLRRAGRPNEFPLLEGLRYRGDVPQHVERILADLCGFRAVAVSPENDWHRRLLLYERRHVNEDEEEEKHGETNRSET